MECPTINKLAFKKSKGKRGFPKENEKHSINIKLTKYISLIQFPFEAYLNIKANTILLII